MSDRKSIAPPKTRPQQPDRLVGYYREIGLSAVVAAFCVVSDPIAAKDPAQTDERMPSFLQQESGLFE